MKKQSVVSVSCLVFDNKPGQSIFYISPSSLSRLRFSARPDPKPSFLLYRSLSGLSSPSLPAPLSSPGIPCVTFGRQPKVEAPIVDPVVIQYGDHPEKGDTR